MRATTRFCYTLLSHFSQQSAPQKMHYWRWWIFHSSLSMDIIETACWAWLTCLHIMRSHFACSLEISLFCFSMRIFSLTHWSSSTWCFRRRDLKSPTIAIAHRQLLSIHVKFKHSTEKLWRLEKSKSEFSYQKKVYFFIFPRGSWSVYQEEKYKFSLNVSVLWLDYLNFNNFFPYFLKGLSNACSLSPRRGTPPPSAISTWSVQLLIAD